MIRVSVESPSRLLADLMVSTILAEPGMTVASAGPVDLVLLIEPDIPASEDPPDAVVVRRGLGQPDTSVAQVLEQLRQAGSAPGGVSEVTAPPNGRRRELTGRELEVLRLIASGMTTLDVASRLSISPRTVDGHQRRLFTKLGVQSRGHAVMEALRRGALTPSEFENVPRPGPW